MLECLFCYTVCFRMQGKQRIGCFQIACFLLGALQVPAAEVGC